MESVECLFLLYDVYGKQRNLNNIRWVQIFRSEPGAQFLGGGRARHSRESITGYALEQSEKGQFVDIRVGDL